MTNIVVTTKVSRPFSLDRFWVSADLIGATHNFAFEDKSIVVRLPQLDEEGVSFDQRKVFLRKWQGEVPVEYQINELDVDVQIEDPIRVPKEVLRRRPNQSELLTKDEQQHALRPRNWTVSG
jgi:hypothetical protein